MAYNSYAGINAYYCYYGYYLFYVIANLTILELAATSPLG